MIPYWTDGKRTIYHGDCREILPELGIFDLCVTDPPYGVGLQYDGYNDSRSQLIGLVREALPKIVSSALLTLITCGNGSQYLYPEPDWTLAWIIEGAVTRCSWGFCSWQPILAYGRDPFLRDGLGARPDVIYCNEASRENFHPSPKPLDLWRQLVKRGSTRERDKLLDPFMGSGTTLLVAKEFGMEAVGIEQSEKYCEHAARELERQGVLW